MPFSIKIHKLFSEKSWKNAVSPNVNNLDPTVYPAHIPSFHHAFWKSFQLFFVWSCWHTHTHTNQQLTNRQGWKHNLLGRGHNVSSATPPQTCQHQSDSLIPWTSCIVKSPWTLERFIWSFNLCHIIWCCCFQTAHWSRTIKPLMTVKTTSQTLIISFHQLFSCEGCAWKSMWAHTNYFWLHAVKPESELTNCCMLWFIEFPVAQELTVWRALDIFVNWGAARSDFCAVITCLHEPVCVHVRLPAGPHMSAPCWCFDTGRKDTAVNLCWRILKDMLIWLMNAGEMEKGRNRLNQALLTSIMHGNLTECWHWRQCFSLQVYVRVSLTVHARVSLCVCVCCVCVHADGFASVFV